LSTEQAVGGVVEVVASTVAVGVVLVVVVVVGAIVVQSAAVLSFSVATEVLCQ